MSVSPCPEGGLGVGKGSSKVQLIAELRNIAITACWLHAKDSYW